MYVFLFFPIWYICLYEFMMKQIAEKELVANCLQFCYSFTVNKKMGGGWLLDIKRDELHSYLQLKYRESRFYKPLPSFCSHICINVDVVRTTSNHESSSSGFSAFCQECLLFGSLEEQKITASQNICS